MVQRARTSQLVVAPRRLAAAYAKSTPHKTTLPLLDLFCSGTLHVPMLALKNKAVTPAGLEPAPEVLNPGQGICLKHST